MQCHGEVMFLDFFLLYCFLLDDPQLPVTSVGLDPGYRGQRGTAWLRPRGSPCTPSGGYPRPLARPGPGPLPDPGQGPAARG